MLLTPRTRSVAVHTSRPVLLQLQNSPPFRYAKTKSVVLHLRFRVRFLAVEFLELLNVHPAVPGADSTDKREDLGIAERCRCVAQDEAAAIVIDERDSAVAGRKDHRAAGAYHLPFGG